MRFMLLRHRSFQLMLLILSLYMVHAHFKLITLSLHKLTHAHFKLIYGAVSLYTLISINQINILNRLTPALIIRIFLVSTMTTQ